ncbi:hypothetical protein FORC82_p187 (plasmid) [Escherichia coli]|nr:hypothetical protein FORC82_p187 [Escherichia coli]
MVIRINRNFTIGEVMEKAKCNGIEIVGVGIKTDEIIVLKRTLS